MKQTIGHPEILILLRLLLAHAIAGLFFQRKPLVSDQSIKIWRNKLLLAHSFAAAFLAYSFSWRWGSWWFLILVFAAHIIIDGSCARWGNGILLFIVGQISHITVLFIGWLWLSQIDHLAVYSIFHSLLLNRRTWVFSLAYVLILWPTGVLIGKMTEPWRREIDKKLTDGLKKAGLWIGFLERFLIVTFIFLQSYELIGFLIASKSILRYGELSSGENGRKNNSTIQKKTEYILIGTMLSFTAALMIGFFSKWILTIQ